MDRRMEEMSLIVLGMEMPENCRECRLMVDYFICTSGQNGARSVTVIEEEGEDNA